MEALSPSRAVPESQEADVDYYAEGLRLQELGDIDNALAYAKQAVLATPNDRRALHLLGQCFLQLNRPQDCITVMSALIEADSLDAMALNNRGVAFDHLGNLQSALEDFEAATHCSADYEDALLNRASCLERLSRFSEAIEAYEHLKNRSGCAALAWYGWANSWAALDQTNQAEMGYYQALQRDPKLGLAWYNLGLLQLAKKSFDDSIESFVRAADLLRPNASAWNNCGNAWNAKGDNHKALECYSNALKENPSLAEAHFNCSLVFNRIGRSQEALGSVRKAIELNPLNAQAHNVLGVVLVNQKRLIEAVEAFGESQRLDPRLAEAYVNEANAHELMLEHEKAIACYQKAYALKPDYPYLKSRLLYKQMYICDWSQAGTSTEGLLQEIRQHDKVCDPFRILAFTDDPELHRRVSEQWHKSHPLPEAPDHLPVQHQRGSKIRLGYFSADFHNHATAHLMAELFELHDREKFEIYAFSFGPEADHPMRYRLEKAFDHFMEVGHLDDSNVASLSRELGIDIAIDLKGFTFDNRMNIFRYRAAPIQVNYLGYPGTIGGDFIDYLIADRYIVPPNLQDHYSERIVYTSGCYQVNDRKRTASDLPLSREDMGLPTEGIVFCCFNNNYKIRPEVFDVWGRILERVPDSVLWLLGDSEIAQQNLRREARLRGLGESRLVFAPRVSQEEHLRRHQAADIFLDTFPCNAHTTASDALWMGLPIVTLAGQAFASRVAGSLVHHIGCSELIATDLQQYEELAVELATSPTLLQRYRSTIAKNHQRVFDAETFCRDFERLLEVMVNSHLELKTSLSLAG